MVHPFIYFNQPQMPNMQNAMAIRWDTNSFHFIGLQEIIIMIIQF